MDQSSEAVNAIREPLLKALETVHMLLVSLPSGSYGDAEAEHQLDTAILALALGTLLEYPERDLRVLACASLLHETGRYAFSNSMSGDDKLNSFLQREHPAFSATLLRGWVPDQHDLETAILQHHERYDGSGFPNGLRGLETPPGVLRKSQAGFMDRFAEILLIANAFSAHRLGLGDFDAASELDVITHLLESSEVLYNPSVVLELSKLIQRFPVGAPVRILSTSSGRFVGFTGVVRETDSESETLPIKNLLVTRNAKGQQVKPMEIEFKSERRARFALADSL